MRQLVAAALPLRSGVILDPFMGCGSTIAAAQVLGIRSIGIEINETYFKLAKKAVPKLTTFEVMVNGKGGAHQRIAEEEASISVKGKLRRHRTRSNVAGTISGDGNDRRGRPA